MTFQVRLRHPKGVSTITVDPQSTVADLQQTIFSSSEIPPSLQELKAGYPPRTLTLVPSLPVESLGLQKGDQLIVGAASGSTASTSNRSTTTSSANPHVNAPAFLPRTAPKQETPSDVSVPVEGGTLVHRVVPDDNSCLFSSIGILFEQDMNAAPRLRKVVVDQISKDPETYNDVLLERPREEYMKTIAKPSAWGGAIGMSPFDLSNDGNTENDPKSLLSSPITIGLKYPVLISKPVDVTVLVKANGITDYDAVSLAPTPTAPYEFHQTVFPVDSTAITNGAAQLASKLRAKKAYTNTATFDLKCERCGQGLKGEKEARQHAMETGHAEFGEY
ncbi:ubiquitin-specific protease otu1 [Tulasnella sp. 419]|nr:ubiquitin-specific protease otu1 [Tulasnella sp. 419]